LKEPNPLTFFLHKTSIIFTDPHFKLGTWIDLPGHSVVGTCFEFWVERQPTWARQPVFAPRQTRVDVPEVVHQFLGPETDRKPEREYPLPDVLWDTAQSRRTCSEILHTWLPMPFMPPMPTEAIVPKNT